MLEVKNVSKIYRTDEVELKALDDVSINLRRNEFVSILGPSGSGKTTLLNIIGGLDRYTSGDLIIDGVSTKDYYDRDWDTYRNHNDEFIFCNFFKKIHNLDASFRVERTGRLVRENNTRVINKSASDGDALHLSAGKLTWELIYMIL